MRTLIAAAALIAAVTSAEAVEYQPNDIRPWQAYIDAKKALKASGLDRADDAAAFMIGRLGPLPWRFEPTETTPFKTMAVAKRMYTKIEGETRYGEVVTRVEINYPEMREGLQGEDQAIFVKHLIDSPAEEGWKCTYDKPYRTYR